MVIFIVYSHFYTTAFKGCAGIVSGRQKVSLDSGGGGGGGGVGVGVVGGGGGGGVCV